MTQALAPRDDAALMERAVIQGDLSQLDPAERVSYYRRVCDSLKLNPYTKPFDYLELDNGSGGKKLVLYAKRDCTDQLRKIDNVSIVRLQQEWANGLYIVTAYATTPDGRTDSAIGAVAIGKEGGVWEDVVDRQGKVVVKSDGKPKRRFVSDGSTVLLSGDALANAIMRAETKAKRRVTLSICGLGMTDESEVDSIPGARVVDASYYDAPSPSQPEPHPEAVDGGDALEAWKRAAAEAKRLGVEHKPLGEDAPLEKIRRWTAALEARLETARQAATYDKIQADFDRDPPTDAEKTAPRDQVTGEVLDQTVDTRARLATLLDMAKRRGLSADPPLAHDPGVDPVEAAIAYWEERITNHDLDQQLAPAGAAL